MATLYITNRNGNMFSDNFYEGGGNDNNVNMLSKNPKLIAKVMRKDKEFIRYCTHENKNLRGCLVKLNKLKKKYEGLLNVRNLNKIEDISQDAMVQLIIDIDTVIENIEIKINADKIVNNTNDEKAALQELRELQAELQPNQQKQDIQKLQANQQKQDIQELQTRIKNIKRNILGLNASLRTNREQQVEVLEEELRKKIEAYKNNQKLEPSQVIQRLLPTEQEQPGQPTGSIVVPRPENLAAINRAIQTPIQFNPVDELDNIESLSDIDSLSDAELDEIIEQYNNIKTLDNYVVNNYFDKPRTDEEIKEEYKRLKQQEYNINSNSDATTSEVMSEISNISTIPPSRNDMSDISDVYTARPVNNMSDIRNDSTFASQQLSNPRNNEINSLNRKLTLEKRRNKLFKEDKNEALSEINSLEQQLKIIKSSNGSNNASSIGSNNASSNGSNNASSRSNSSSSRSNNASSRSNNA